MYIRLLSRRMQSDYISYILQGGLKESLIPPPGVDDPGGGEGLEAVLADKVFVHSVTNAGKKVSVKAMKHENNLFVYLSASSLEKLSKEW